MSRPRFLRDILLVLLWLGVIFTLSTRAGAATHTNSLLDGLLARFFPALFHRLTWPELDGLHYYIRKAAHLTEYAVLGVLMVRAFRQPNAVLNGRRLLLAWALCALYAATDEFHQVFVPGRTPKVTDVILDAAGAAFGVVLIRAVFLHRSPPVPEEPINLARH